jgi:hypothetical protein
LRPFSEGGHIARVGIGRPVSDKPNHRHRPLLRTRGERPRSRRAADERDELAPAAHSITSSARAHHRRRTISCRDFVPWRFSAAGRWSAWLDRRYRRPKTLHERTLVNAFPHGAYQFTNCQRDAPSAGANLLSAGTTASRP